MVREPEQLGRAIRAARTAAALSQVEAAAALGISKQTLADLESGKPTVAVGTALRVANELGVSLFMAPARHRERVRRAVLEAG
jgi:transcriptional regulator with XRE-family HTH domain